MSFSPLRRIVLTLAVALLGATLATASVPACDRVLAVGDVHGGFDALLTILAEAELIGDDRSWNGDGACLVQLGDMLDRGARSREVMDYLIGLQRQAGDRVTVLLGNHEVMNIVGNLAYTDPGEFGAFADEETTAERDQGFAMFLATSGAQKIPESGRRAAFDEQFPPGWFAHRRAFAPEGEYGAWLMGLPVVVQIDRTVFVHGGVVPSDAATGIEKINETVHREIREYVDLRGKLERAGLLTPLIPYHVSFNVVEWQMNQAVEQDEAVQQSELYRDATRFLALRQSAFQREDGPLWVRPFGTGDESAFAGEVERSLDALGADRMVVGHSVQDDGNIAARYGGRVFAIDTGAGPFYDGRPSALEISGDKVHAIYPGASEVLVAGVVAAAAASPGETAAPAASATRVESDDDTERFLLEATVVDIKEIGVGITKPKVVTLELDGETRRAAFKHADIQETGMTRFASSGTEMNFSDRYQYERAAYILDRVLGMNAIPVAVIRRIGGDQGAVIDWVEDAITEKERMDDNLMPDDPAILMRQRAVMKVFDALILNVDRNLGNQLITLDDWKVHLIDHSRSFRTTKKLPEGFEKTPVSITRPFLEALEKLDAADLQERMGGLLSKVQIKAMLARRDRILEKVEADVAKYGEAMVFPY